MIGIGAALAISNPNDVTPANTVALAGQCPMRCEAIQKHNAVHGAMRLFAASRTQKFFRYPVFSHAVGMS